MNSGLALLSNVNHNHMRLHLHHYGPISLSREIKELPEPVKRMSLVVFLYYLSWGIVIPFLPIYFKEILGTFTNVSFVESLIYLFGLIWFVPIGDLLDRVSSKKFLFVILALYLPLGPIITLLKTLYHFIYFKIYHSFLASGFWTTAESYVRGHSPKNKTSESIGLYHASYAFSVVIGAVIGGILATKFGIKNLLFIMPVIIFSAILSTIGMHDHNKDGKFLDGMKKIFSNRLFTKEFSEFFKNTNLVKLGIINFLVSIVLYTPTLLLPLFSKELGANFIQIGIIYSLFYLPIISEVPFSILSDKVNKKTTMMLGALFTAIVLFWLFKIHSIKTIFIASFLLSVSSSALISSLSGAITDSMPKEKTGEFTGVNKTLESLGAALGVFFVGPLADKFSINTPFILGFGLMMVVFLCIIFWVNNRK